MTWAIAWYTCDSYPSCKEVTIITSAQAGGARAQHAPSTTPGTFSIRELHTCPYSALKFHCTAGSKVFVHDVGRLYALQLGGEIPKAEQGNALVHLGHFRSRWPSSTSDDLHDAKGHWTEV